METISYFTYFSRFVKEGVYEKVEGEDIKKHKIPHIWPENKGFRTICGGFKKIKLFLYRVYFYLLQTKIQCFLMGVKEDVQTVVSDASANVFHGVDHIVNHDLRPNGED